MIRGAFVRVRFPTREAPDRRGLLHIGYILGRTTSEVVVAYTTSRPWPADTPLPAGVRLFSAGAAARLNQSRPFLIRLDVLAKLPRADDWFPDLGRPDQGVIAVAPPELRSELVRVAENLIRRRRELVQMHGP